MKIDIVGTGLTASSYDWTRDTFKWSVSQFSDVYQDKIHLYFAMHTGQTTERANEITLGSYPLKAIMEWSGSKYFTSSIAYMVAYALFTGATEINIFGVDMEHDTEYATQRPCLAYWIGFARAKGCNIKVMSVLDERPFLYGYDTEMMQNTIAVLTERMESSRIKAHTTDGAEREQWIGSMHAHKKIIELLRG